MRVLIADDAAFIRIMLRDILVKGEHEVVGEAKDGIEAIKLYFEHNPDVAILNINMGDVDGLKTMRAILQKDPNAKIVVCSADSRHETVLTAIKLGAKSFLVKPFLPEKVYETLEKVVGDDLKFNVNIDKSL